MSRWLGALAIILAGSAPAAACSLCSSIQQTPTFRQEAAQAKLILFGSMSNPRLVGGGNGVTDFHVDAVLRDHPARKDRAVLEIARYVPVSDPKNPPQFLIFCDVLNDRIDPYRGVPVKSRAAADYLQGVLNPKLTDRAAVLLYCKDFLEHPDLEVGQDAYLEFAKATDQDIGQVAAKMAPGRLRAWIKDPNVPSNRLSLYAFLLGACGGSEDAALLRTALQDTGERCTGAFDGLLGGYIQLRPDDGWDLAMTVLRDEKRTFLTRYGVLRTIRFFHGWKPQENNLRILRGMELVLARSDMADMALDDLRRWQCWDLTREVVSLYGQKGYEAPLMRRAIVRYALCCPRTEAERLVTEVRQRDPELVKDVEESLRLEKLPSK